MLVKRFLPHPVGVLDVSPLHTHWGPALGDQCGSTLLGLPIGKAFPASGTHTRPDCHIRGPSASRKAWRTGRKLWPPLAALPGFPSVRVESGGSPGRPGLQQEDGPLWSQPEAPSNPERGVSGSSTSRGEARSPSSARSPGAGSPGLPTASPRPWQGLRPPWNSPGSPSHPTIDGGSPKPRSELRSPGTGKREPPL